MLSKWNPVLNGRDFRGKQKMKEEWEKIKIIQRGPEGQNLINPVGVSERRGKVQDKDDTPALILYPVTHSGV